MTEESLSNIAKVAAQFNCEVQKTEKGIVHLVTKFSPKLASGLWLEEPDESPFTTTGIDEDK
jgi:hypothetical protein